MSGGSMDYVAWKIRDAARHIQRELANAELCRKNGRFFDVYKRYQEEHPELEYLKITNPDTCPDAPRYKACGNGWATNQPRWILTRLLTKEGVEW